MLGRDEKNLCVGIPIDTRCGIACARANVDAGGFGPISQQWARENLDDDALRMLQGSDQQRVKSFLAELEKQFTVNM